jgi:hypothetical protein
VRRLLRRVLFIPPPALSFEEAERIARAEAERRGWGWADPIHRHETLRGFRFRTNADKRGGNAEIMVRADTGEIVRAWFGPR